MNTLVTKHRTAVNRMKVLAVLPWNFAAHLSGLEREWPRASGHPFPPATSWREGGGEGLVHWEHISRRLTCISLW